MCGYTDYSDPRLQPSDVGDDEMTPIECWQECVHGTACVALLVRLNGGGMIGLSRAVRTMGCAECDQWEEA